MERKKAALTLMRLTSRHAASAPHPSTSLAQCSRPEASGSRPRKSRYCCVTKSVETSSRKGEGVGVATGVGVGVGVAVGVGSTTGVGVGTGVGLGVGLGVGTGVGCGVGTGVGVGV